MKILILGGSGMLGHKLYQVCSERFETYATFRSAPVGKSRQIFRSDRIIDKVTAGDLDAVSQAITTAKPDVVVNCIGIVKQDTAAKDALTSIAINALFPHQLAKLCEAAGARLIHVSTDCVFSGRKGSYRETDESDATDIYGKTKFLGEVSAANCLTVRTSMIGRELSGTHGLLEWFLSQGDGRVRGFRQAIFSGFTTHALADVITRIVTNHPELTGVYHVAAEPINKFELLSQIKNAYSLNTAIDPDDAFVCDRSLNASRFNEATGFVPTPWPQMIKQMRDDSTPYDEIRKPHSS